MAEYKLLTEIDDTLDQLLQNAKTLRTIGKDQLFEEERGILGSIQESLVSHLYHLNDRLPRSASRISFQEKIEQLSEYEYEIVKRRLGKIYSEKRPTKATIRPHRRRKPQ